MQSTQTTERNLETMGARICAARKAARLSAAAAARHVGISRGQFWNWETDKAEEPGLKSLMTFARLVDINLDWLVTGQGPAPEFLKTKPPKSRRR
jgi:transcriptional regulator with XRE-family HTH domain